MTATSRSTASALDPRLPAKHLSRGEDGGWYACGREAISYSTEGNAKCFELEEGAFWFAHRGACLQATVRRLPPSGVIYDIGGGNGFVMKTLIDAGFETVLVEPGETGARNAAR